jgi:outer membrane protein OmpA-like peptidoglycan-associated protein
MTGSTTLGPLFMIGLLWAAVPRSADAQFTRIVKDRIKQKVEERKRQTEETLVTRATEPADSALERIMSPVDTVAGKVGSKAGAAVGRVGRGPDPVAEEEGLLKEQLAAGQADLTGVTFEPGSEALDPGSEPTLNALARVLLAADGTFLLQGRAEPGTADIRSLAELRAVALKSWLVSLGVPGERVFAAGDGEVRPGGAQASVLRMQ